MLVEPRAHSRSRWLVKGRGLRCCTRRAATQWRTVQTGVSWFREEWAPLGSLSRSDGVASPGEETLGCTVAAKGKRRSRPLPTKAIDEAVGERGSGRYPLGDLARVG
jgi:hypothetical protein